MKRWLAVLGLALVAALPTQAQEAPKLELFQGFSHLRQDLGGFHKNFFGFGSAFSFNLNEKFGIEGDFSGQYATLNTFFGSVTLQNYEYMGGPRLSLRREKATLFLHALFGGATLSDQFGGSESGWAMAFGLGYDLNVGEGAAIRIVQADYFSTRFFGGQQDNVRFSVGFVLKMGGE